MRIPVKYGWKGGRKAKQETYIKLLRQYVQRKTKVKNVKIDERLNTLIWREKPRVVEVDIEIKDGTAFVKLPEMTENVKADKNV